MPALTNAYAITHRDTASGWNSLRVANFGGIKSWVAHERVVLAV
jgi:hypothetical protein